jgi:hypothetical protein
LNAHTPIDDNASTFSAHRTIIGSSELASATPTISTADPTLTVTQSLTGGDPGGLPSGSGYADLGGNDSNALVSVNLAEINHAPLPAREKSH